jgi:NIPSNAP
MTGMVGERTVQLVEFRNYEIVPGGVDAFVKHFEDHFLAAQEELGMQIVGQFRDVGDASRFVWIRRYLTPSSRGASLQRFYTGPVWREFGPRANELMVDHADVHLLVPDPSLPAFAHLHVPHVERRDTPPEPTSTVVAAFYDVDEPNQLPPEIVSEMAAAVADAPAVSELGRLVTAAVPNDFTRLPVHEDVTIALWLLADHDHGDVAASLAESISPQCGRTHRLGPTARSTLQ